MNHIGALPYILPRINVPIYDAALTWFFKIKLEEFGLLKQASLHEIRGGENITIGSIKVGFFSTNHSIPDSVGVILRTQQVIVYTSDFKFDHTPVLGDITQFDLLADVGREGVLVVLSDSTNAERQGYTHSEKEVGRRYEIFICRRKDYYCFLCLQCSPNSTDSQCRQFCRKKDCC